MGKLHYWNGIDFGLNEASSLDGSGSVIAQILSLRDFNEASVRTVWFPQLVCHVRASGRPPDAWWVSTKVTLFVTADPEGSVTQRFIDVDDPLFLGFCELHPRVYYVGTANDYYIVWEGPGEGLDLHTGRKGNGANFNGVLGQLNYADQHGVFVGVYSPATLFNVSLEGRVLWSTDTPRTP